MAELLAFHFTIVKTLRDPGASFTLVIKAKHETKSSGRPRVHGGTHVDEPMLQAWAGVGIRNIGSTFTETGTIDKD